MMTIIHFMDIFKFDYYIYALKKLREVKMKTKIICILIITILITTALPTLGVKLSQTEYEKPPALQNGGVDQEQTTHSGYGMVLSPPEINAQSFKPTKENLTNVQLWIFKYSNPPAGVEITVSIRDDLEGADLTTATVNADDVGIKRDGTWVMFDINDIIVTPEETYYIVCYASDGGIEGNCYCWFFGFDNPYTRGDGWMFNNTAGKWITLWEWLDFDPEYPEPDFCFKTYHKISRDKTINKSLQQFLQSHPNLFSLINKLLQRLGL